MAQLVLLVVAAAWAAVLLPPMLRSRVENRPNSSVTDFRQQLNKLQNTATPSRGTLRVMGRPLAPSPMQRPAAGGRPGLAHHRQAAVHSAAPAPARARSGGTQPGSRPTDQRNSAQFRTHGDPTGGHERPHRETHMNRAAPPQQSDPRVAVKRRRSNVLFLLVITTACTLFLAGTTSSTVMLYAFALSFLGLCGYVYLLAQLRQRDAAGWNDGWLENH